MLTKDFLDEFARYRAIGQKALAQISDDSLNRIPCKDGNSVAMVVRHISGNLKSRFTDFLHSDGDKPWRQRDSEFEERIYSRSDVDTMWAAGWDVLEKELATLTDADLESKVTIRGIPLTVHEALCRASAHIAYHVGQVVLLARMHAQADWRWISLPKAKSVRQ